MTRLVLFKPSVASGSLVSSQPDTLDCIATFAGDEARSIVIQNLNRIGNVMNIEANASMSYHSMRWGIEASLDDEDRVR